MNIQVCRYVLLAVFLTDTGFSQTNTFPSAGNVGIGTVWPRSRLDIGGHLGAGNGARFGDYLEINEREDINNASSIGWNAYIFADDGTYAPVHSVGTGMVLSMHSGGYGSLDFWGINWGGSSSPKQLGAFNHVMHLGTSGNVGIGTAAPEVRLDLAGNQHIRSSYFLRFPYSGELNADDGKLAVGMHAQGLNIVGSRTDGTHRKVSVWGEITQHQNDGANAWAGNNIFNGNVGIGTTSPGAKLVVSDGGAVGLELAPSNSSNSALMEVYDRSSSTYKNLRILSANTFLNDLGGNVGIGTTNPQHKLSVNGAIKAKEIIVETTGWADFVFADGYRLASLSEVELHIAEKKHLPGVPSATEVAEKGVNIVEVQAALLAKVEELTLHLIAQEKSLRDLRVENEALKSRMHSYEQR